MNEPTFSQREIKAALTVMQSGGLMGTVNWAYSMYENSGGLENFEDFKKAVEAEQKKQQPATPETSATPTTPELPATESGASAPNADAKADAPAKHAPQADQRYIEYCAYLTAIFRPGDVLCFASINHATNVTLQIFATLEDALTLESFQNLIRDNANASIYVAMNTYPASLVGQRKGRTQENVVAVRALQSDMDDAQQAANIVSAMQTSAKVPPPSIVVESSPGKRQGIWLVDGIAKEDAKPLMQAIAAEFKTDSAVAEVARVMRLPGFVNRKYATAPVAKLLVNTGVRYTRDSFKIDLAAAVAKIERTSPEEYLDAPFIREGGPYGGIYPQVLKIVGHYHATKSIDDGDVMFSIVKGYIEKNGCYFADGITPFTWDEKQVLDQCRKLIDEFNEKKQREQAAETSDALSEAANVGEQAVALAKTVQPSTLVLNQQSDAPVAPVLVPETIPVILSDDDPSWPYAITREEYEEQLDQEFPVIPLKAGAGPGWDDDVMYGVVGEIVRKITVYNEAHPAGLYLDFLVSLGSIIGRDPYFNVTSTRHYTNEFLARVGDTSKSRKGTGREEVNRVLSMIDPRWFTECSASGFGSAEAIIYNIRDDAVKQVRKRQSNTFENVPVPGVSDKRLMIREGELASVFQLAGKKESRADIVLRDGWDSIPLNNKVKGNTNGINNSASVQRPHISISADTTRNELMSKMPPGADSNGFGNRFLYCFVQRVKMCPQGGPIPDLMDEIERLGRAIALARGAGCVGLSTAARKLWGRMYQKLEEESSIGSSLACSMMARAAAHVRRLALILCLLDEPEGIGGFQVEVEHLRAAKAIWDYCAESARFIFGGVTREQIAIHDWLQRNGPKTVSEITQQLFHKNRKVEWVRHQVNALIGTNKVTVDGDKITAK